MTPIGSSAYLLSCRIEWRIIFLGFWLLVREGRQPLMFLTGFLVCEAMDRSAVMIKIDKVLSSAENGKRRLT